MGCILPSPGDISVHCKQNFQAFVLSFFKHFSSKNSSTFRLCSTKKLCPSPVKILTKFSSHVWIRVNGLMYVLKNVYMLKFDRITSCFFMLCFLCFYSLYFNLLSSFYHTPNLKEPLGFELEVREIPKLS